MTKSHNPSSSHVLTCGTLLARNSLFNLVGEIAPQLAAFVVMPVLVRDLGAARFGLLTIVWLVIGYFTLFDVGLGRALTRFVAQKLGTGDVDQIPALVWTSLLLLFALGTFGALCLALLSPWLATSALNIPQALQLETARSLYLLSLSLPSVIITAALRGLLQARQSFGALNALRLPMGLVAYCGPLLVLHFYSSLVPIVATLAASRVLFALIHLLLCFQVMPSLRHRVAINFRQVGQLLRFGGWLTVSNVVTPAMLYLDRFVVGALLSAAALAYYVTPYSAVTALLAVPSAVVAVLFPAFATSFARDPHRAANLCTRGLKSVFALIFPVTLVIVLFAHTGLRLWLGPEFADRGSRVLQLLAIGVFINSVAFVPSSLLQSTGRPDLTAKLSLFELPVYVVVVWSMTRAFGIEGTALAWSLRAAIDALILFAMTRRLLPAGTFAYTRVEIPVAYAMCLLAVGMAPVTGLAKAACGVCILAFAAYTLCFVLLDSRDRIMLQSLALRSAS